MLLEELEIEKNNAEKMKESVKKLQVMLEGLNEYKSELGKIAHGQSLSGNERDQAARRK